MAKPSAPNIGETDSSVQDSPPSGQDAGAAVASPVPPGDAAVTLSPEAWAETYFPPSTSGRLHDDAWKHASASVLHGWAAYQMRTGRNPAVTRQTYLGAIAAVSGSTFIAFPAADYRTRG